MECRSVAARRGGSRRETGTAKPMETGNNELLRRPNGGAGVSDVFEVRFQQTGHLGKVWSSSCISMDLLRI